MFNSYFYPHLLANKEYWNNGNFSNLIKITCQKPTATCTEKIKRLKIFPLQPLNKQGRTSPHCPGDASLSNKMYNNNNKNQKEQ